MAAPAAGLPATPMWLSSMTATTGSGCPSSQQLPAAVVAEVPNLGTCNHTRSLLTCLLEACLMKRGWAAATSKEYNKRNCSWSLVTLCSVEFTLTLLP